MNWKLFSAEEGKGWDRLLDPAGDDNPFQSEAWARYKRNSGWESQRWVASLNGKPPLCAVQLLKKSLPLGRTALWAPGGPVIGFPDAGLEDLRKILPEGIRQIGRVNRAAYGRFYALQPSVLETRRVFSGVCAVPKRPLGSGTTVQVNLDLSREDLLSGMDRKHRYLVRRVSDPPLRWSWGASEVLVTDFSRLHAEMAAAKKVSAEDENDLARLISAFRENARILIGYAGDEPVTACLILLKGKNAFYWRAATARKGRELSASYAMIWELLKRLKEQGIRRFDFGGILPGVPSAAGINHFKQGFGGTQVEYLGEWEWARPSWIRWGVNAWVACRRGR